MKISGTKLPVPESNDGYSDSEEEYDSGCQVVQHEASNQHETHSDLIVVPAEGSGSKQPTEECVLQVYAGNDSDEEDPSELWDAIDEQVNESESDEDSLSDRKDFTDKMKDELASWHNSFNITHNAMDALLKLLKQSVPQLKDLPSSTRTLTKTPKSVGFSCISNMQCHHFGLKNEIVNILGNTEPTLLQDIQTLELVINVDGLPLFKSSKTCLWPILCMISNVPPAHRHVYSRLQ